MFSYFQILVILESYLEETCPFRTCKATHGSVCIQFVTKLLVLGLVVHVSNNEDLY